MTLFRQMAIMTSLIIITLLIAVIGITYESSKKDMIENLYETTVNNISTLTSKLAVSAGDKAILASIIDAEFDSGYYKMIDFKSNDKKSDYIQVDSEKVKGIPSWFIDFTDLELEPITADVTSGWTILGTVTVVGDTNIIYQALYKMFINLSYLFAISIGLSLVGLYISLHFILKPLKRVQTQAEAIIKNEFVIQNKIPFTIELKDTIKAMNIMVNKVEEIFNKSNKTAQRNKELLYSDPTTKLFNRRYLMLKLPELIKLENKVNGGVIMFLSLSGAEVLNQTLGYKKTDEMFLDLALLFNNICNNYDEKVVARVNGTEFTILIPNCESDIAITLANEINQRFNKLLTKNEIISEKIFINIGICKYKPNITSSDLLTRADNALFKAKSKVDEDIHLYEEEEEKNALGKEQWRNIIKDSVKNKYFLLKFWPTINSKTKNIDHKVMTFSIDNNDKKYNYGDFIAPAINLGFVSKIYLVALENLFTKEDEHNTGALCSIRMPNEFINDPKSYEQLENLFKKYAKILNFKISFEVSDTFAINNTIVVKRFLTLFAQYNFTFGINSFTGDSNDYTYLKILNPEFIKSDCNFLLDQSKDSMSSLQLITHSLGINIIATFVNTEEEVKRLSDMNIDIVQGPVTDLF